MEPASRGPDLIEGVLVMGNHPALGDLAAGDTKDAHGPPPEGFTAVPHLASGEDHRTLIISEHSMHRERLISLPPTLDQIVGRGLLRHRPAPWRGVRPQHGHRRCRRSPLSEGSHPAPTQTPADAALAHVR